MKEEGLYIHVPYCSGKCLYCDFFSGGVVAADFMNFSRSLVNELKERRGELQSVPSTLYIGGGTPSVLPGELFTYIVGKVSELTGRSGEWDEFTIEVNPEDVDEEKCRLWARNGVNRLSIGIQTLDDYELKRIGRRHDSRRAREAVAMLKKYFNNISVDLMFGLPGQTCGSWRRSVEGIIELQPQHISGYSLMFEPGTPMSVLREQGRMSFPDEEECVDMWHLLSELTGEAGYSQYELSNYALPGRESIHNRRYWSGNPYLGLGPSAHSYDGHRIRRANPGRIKEYISRFKDTDRLIRRGGSAGSETVAGSPFYEEEILTDEELQEEMIMLSMRTRRGLDLDLFRERFGERAYSGLIRNTEKELKTGLIEMSDGFVRLTDAGIMVSDEVIINLC